MVPRGFDRALNALFSQAEHLDEREPAASMPKLDERVALLLRALHVSEHASTPEEQAEARARILDAMADDVLSAGRVDTQLGTMVLSDAAASLQQATPDGATADHTRPHTLRRLLRRWSLSSFSSVTTGGWSPVQLAIVSLAGLAMVGAGWTTLWFWAAARLEATVITSIGEASTGSGLNCASRNRDGFPFEVRVQCHRPNMTLTVAGEKAKAEARELAMRARPYDASFFTADLTGPVALSATNTSLTIGWNTAQIRSDREPAKLSVTIDGIRMSRGQNGGLGATVLTASAVQLDASGLRESAGGSAVVTGRVEGAVIDLDGLVAPKPLNATIQMALNALVRVTSLRTWQMDGGRVVVRALKVEQGDHLVVAQGTIGLTVAGRLEGRLTIDAGGDFAALAQSIVRDGLTRTADEKRLTQSLLGTRLSPRALTVPPMPSNRVPGSASELSLGQVRPERAPTDVRTPHVELPLRFIDGAVFLDTKPLGAVPAFF